MADIRLLAGYECLQPRLIEIVKIKIQKVQSQWDTHQLSLNALSKYFASMLYFQGGPQGYHEIDKVVYLSFL